MVLETFNNLVVIQKSNISTVYCGEKNKKTFIIKEYIDKIGSTQMTEREELIMEKQKEEVWPNSIYKIIDVIKSEKNIIITNYIQGLDLLEYLNKIKKNYLKERKARFIMKRLLNSVLFLHKKNIVHGDIKQENVMIELHKDNLIMNVVLIDFGASRILSEKENYIIEDKEIGTSGYIAPETLTSNYISFGNDIWALGILYYELLVGEQPYRGSVDKIVEEIMNKELEIPNFLSFFSRKIIKKMLEKNPKDRISIEELYRYFV